MAMTHGSPPVVDIGIPTRGRAMYLAEAIDSVLGQTLADVRITIGENGSGSSSVAAAVAPYLSDPRVRHVVHGEDLGAAGNFSALVQIGEAPYVALLHDDDRWSPGFLERRVEFLKANPACGLVFSGCYVIDGGGAVIDVWEATLAHGVHTPQTFLPAMYDRNLIPVPTVLVRRTAYEAVGPDFSDELLFDDHEMWLRLGSRFDVGCLPDLDASYRVHGDQTSVEHGHGLGRHRLALQDAVEALLPPDVSRDVPRRARSAAHMHAAADAMESGERASVVGHLGQALVRHPATVVSPAGLRRVLLILLALVPGKTGARVWRARRDRGRRLAAAGG
ncbi:MAG: glycosyltransferase, partial [Actinobacteria bacterium]|nr:glycosyltransferase [Actinomycetota bacterium]